MHDGIQHKKQTLSFICNPPKSVADRRVDLILLDCVGTSLGEINR